jgi:hypothetical protein
MVRHASRFQGGFDGVGVRFKAFADDGATRLQQYLRELALKEAAREASFENREPEPKRHVSRRAPRDAAPEPAKPLNDPRADFTFEFDPLADDDIASILD